MTHQDFAVPLHICLPLLHSSSIMQALLDSKTCFRRDLIARSFYRPGLAVSSLCYQMETFSVLVLLGWAVSPAPSCTAACFQKWRILPRQGSYNVGLAAYGELCERVCVCVCVLKFGSTNSELVNMERVSLCMSLDVITLHGAVVYIG